MSQTCIKSIRISHELVDELRKEADEIGITFNNYIISILKNRQSNLNSPEARLLQKISTWLRKNYSTDDFPPDITLKTFHYIKDNKDCFDLYKQAIANKKENKISLHRQIGIMVKDILQAKVIGRSIPLDPKKNLIISYSILTPQCH